MIAINHGGGSECRGKLPLSLLQLAGREVSGADYGMENRGLAEFFQNTASCLSGFERLPRVQER